MKFQNITNILYLCLLAGRNQVYGLSSTPIQSTNTWRIHDLGFADEGHPTSKEISTLFHVYRSKPVSCANILEPNVKYNMPGLQPTECGCRWIDRPFACRWGWYPTEISNHPRNNPNEANNVWRPCTGDPSLPDAEQELPRAVSTLLRYRVIDVIGNKGVKGVGPKGATWQLVKASPPPPPDKITER
jgi:hypothetical protein